LNFYGKNPGLVSQTITGISLQPESPDRIKIYPNPVINYLHIDYPEHKFLNFLVYDITGRKVPVQFFNENNTLTMDFGSVHPGVYLLHINSGIPARSIRIFKK
jgi:hypothetical protein